MAIDNIPSIGPIRGNEEIAPTKANPQSSADFVNALRDAVGEVDGLQHQSSAASTAYARGDQVDLHDVLVKIEEADIAFRAMMEVRNKLVDAYRQVMRLGSGG